MQIGQSRETALAHLEAWLPEATRYADVRNFDHPGHRNISRLSPALARRLVSEHEIIDRVLQRHCFQSVEKYVQEICWRSYWKGWLEQHPTVWNEWWSESNRREACAPDRLVRAESGNTGIECFDAWTKELAETGYLHNHARMWFASIWIFTLGLPWEAGAAFFYRHLLDGDAASNLLSWRWVAGLQTPGKHYVARAENISRFTAGRFEPTGQLREDAEAVKGGPPPRKCPLPEFPELESSKLPESTGFWFHPDDLSIEIAKPDAGPCAIFAAFSDAIAKQADWSPRVSNFYRKALDDALSRAAHVYHVEADHAESSLGLADSICEWAGRRRLKRVAAVRPFVGPWLVIAEELEGRLADRGIEMIWFRRKWDLRTFPHASRGFFPYWQNVRRWFA